MNNRLLIAKRAEEIYLNSNLNVSGALRQAIKEYERREKLRGDFKRVLRRFIH